MSNHMIGLSQTQQSGLSTIKNGAVGVWVDLLLIKKEEFRGWGYDEESVEDY